MYRAPKKAASSGNNATAIEAIEKIVQEKKISTKINYDVLRSLTVPASNNKYENLVDATRNEEANSPGIFGESNINSPDLRTSVFSPSSPTKRQRKTSFSTSEWRDLSLTGSGDISPIKRRLQSPGILNTKRNRNISSNLDLAKDDKADDKETTNNKPKEDNREIVVESGPVDSSTANYDNEEIDEFEDDDDDDIPQSAAELLSKHRGDDRTLDPSEWEEEYY